MSKKHKFDIKILKNGLRIIYCVTPNKNKKYADLNISFGGAFNQIKYNDEIINIKKGTAHLLEHLIIEDSIYGNYVKYMSERHASFNGGTSLFDTSFYFSCVYDFEDHLRELIRLVNIPNLNKIDEVKGPIIEEIKEVSHRNYKHFNEVRNRQLMNYDFYDNVGAIEDIRNYDLEELKKIYDLVYKPENQILILRGNFNIDEIVKLIEEEYDKLNKKNKEYEIITDKNYEVYSKREVVDLETEDDIVSLTFKMRRDDFTLEELRKLNYYFDFCSIQSFSDSSETFKIIKEKKYSNYSINNSLNKIEDFVILSISVYTKYEKEIIDLLLNVINNYKPDEEWFKRWKKMVILNYLVNGNKPRSIVGNLFKNYYHYNYMGVDDMQFLESLNIDEMNNILKKLDFKNYAITVGVRKDETN